MLFAGLIVAMLSASSADVAAAVEPAPVSSQDKAPPGLSPEVRATIDAAIAKGDEKEVAAVLKFAKLANPASAAEIEAIQKAYQSAQDDKRKAQERQKLERLANAGPLDNWKGQAELGAFRSTGSTRNLGVYAALSGEREGLNWRHKINVRAEFQQTNDVTSTERVLASWQPNYKVDDRLYGFGLAQYEHDRSLGYSNRYTAGGGLGYGVLAQSKLKLDVEGGPALRYTDPLAGENEATVAGRASMNLKWTINPRIQFTQNGSVYYEPGDTSANASAALDTQLLGALKVRLSYNILYEHDAPAGRDNLDTTSRATLVYAF